MGSKRTPEGILARVLELSREQAALLEGRRYAELVGLQAERETLLKELSALRGGPGEQLKPLVEEIIQSDTVLTLNIMTVMDELGGKLLGVKNGLKAVKAYSHR